jgi:hypothetical protein
VWRSEICIRNFDGETPHYRHKDGMEIYSTLGGPKIKIKN